MKIKSLLVTAEHKVKTDCGEIPMNISIEINEQNIDKFFNGIDDNISDGYQTVKGGFERQVLKTIAIPVSPFPLS